MFDWFLACNIQTFQPIISSFITLHPWVVNEIKSEPLQKANCFATLLSLNGAVKYLDRLKVCYKIKWRIVKTFAVISIFGLWQIFYARIFVDKTLGLKLIAIIG